MKEIRPVVIVWILAIISVLATVKMNSGALVNYSFVEEPGNLVYALDIFTAIMVVFAIELTVRKPKQMGLNVRESNKKESFEINDYKYTSGTTDYVNLSTQPLTIVAEQ